ncbi:MAG: hypothetical protein WC476_01450 [Phycisphaerae bacterium]|jgi:hypothetical protein
MAEKTLIRKVCDCTNGIIPSEQKVIICPKCMGNGYIDIVLGNPFEAIRKLLDVIEAQLEEEDW